MDVRNCVFFHFRFHRGLYCQKLPVQQLMDKVWGWDAEAEINVVWVNISFLRKKLSELGAHVEIKATRGVGYSLDVRD